jgi:hypothetical protein
MSAGVFGGPHIAHPGKPVYAAYVDGECVAVGTAVEVARAVGVKPKTVYCGCAPSRAARRQKEMTKGSRVYFRDYEQEES